MRSESTGAGDRHKAGAGAIAGLRRQPSRARGSFASRRLRAPSEGALVRGLRAVREAGRAPRRLSRSSDRSRVQRPSWKADIDDLDAAGMLRAGEHVQADLRATEGTVSVGRDGERVGGAAISVDARRYVDGEDLRWARRVGVAQRSRSCGISAPSIGRERPMPRSASTTTSAPSRASCRRP